MLKTFHIFPRHRSLAMFAATFAGMSGIAAAQDTEPVGTVLSVEYLIPGKSCEVDADHQCAFVSSDVARCSMPVEAGCLIFDGDVLTLNGVRIEYRICNGPVRRIGFTDGPLRYEVTGTCPDGVNESLSVLYDLELESIDAEE